MFMLLATHQANFRQVSASILVLFCLALAFGAPLSSSSYQLDNLIYEYDHEVLVRSNVDEFHFNSKVRYEILHVDDNNNIGDDIEKQQQQQLIDNAEFLIKISLRDPQFSANPLDSGFGHQNSTLLFDLKVSQDIYAHVGLQVDDEVNKTVHLKGLFLHKNDPTTFKNIKKSLVQNLVLLHVNDHKEQSTRIVDTNQDSQPELFSPDSISSTAIKFTKLNHEDFDNRNSTSVKLLPLVFESIEGVQNVTFGSRVFREAKSQLTTTFKLKLIAMSADNDQQSARLKPNKSSKTTSELETRIKDANSVHEAIQVLLKHNHQGSIDNHGQESKQVVFEQVDHIAMEREPRVCSHHHCKRTLLELYEDYQASLADSSMASIESAVAYLRIMDKLRLMMSSEHEIGEVLKRIKSKRADHESSFLDILAAARTQASIRMAFKHLKLAKSTNLDSAERFLTALSVSAKTYAKMRPLSRIPVSAYDWKQKPANSNVRPKRDDAFRQQMAQMASLDTIIERLVAELDTKVKWASQKLRWSSLLTLSSLVNANNEHLRAKKTTNNITNNRYATARKVSLMLLKELDKCTDVDCRVVMLQSIANVGHLGHKQLEVIRKYALESSGRESIASMRILRDLMHANKNANASSKSHLDSDFQLKLKSLLLRVIYDCSKETTARVLASDLLLEFVPSTSASQLVLDLPQFNNNELATMIYSRMRQYDSRISQHRNWYWRSCIINGTSTSFVNHMAQTDAVNASYGVNIELLNRHKMLKESSFDVYLNSRNVTQDLFSLAIFARGLSSFGGGSNNEKSNEPTTAGLNLRILGGYLRPYVLFSGYGELMRHVIAGTASEPTTAFNGNLLLIDYDEAYPLISGFVAEHRMRGILSIDVTGENQISLWYKRSHSLVSTKASVIVQASQSIFTSQPNFWQSNLFSFGGQAMIDFMADSTFGSEPMQLCLQVIQPQFLIRFNSRRHYQYKQNQPVVRKIRRKNFHINPKSYSLQSENNKMCSLMSVDL